MNRDDIIRMARQAGGELSSIAEPLEHPWKLSESELICFASLVAQHEREQCAQLVEPTADHLQNPWHYLGGDEGVELLLELAQVIRSRGNQ